MPWKWKLAKWSKCCHITHGWCSSKCVASSHADLLEHGPPASCQFLLSVTYTKIIKRSESPPIEILANVITGKGKYYTALTCFCKLWRFRKINNSGEQQRVSPVVAKRKSSTYAPQSYPHMTTPVCLVWCSLADEPLRNCNSWRQRPPSSISPWLQTQGPHRTQQETAVGANLTRSPATLVCWLTRGEGHELFQHGFDGCEAVGLMLSHPVIKGRRLLLKRRKIIIIIVLV